MALVRDAAYQIDERESAALPLASSAVVFRHSALGWHAGRVRALQAGDLFAGFAGRRVDSTPLADGAPPLGVPIIAAGTAVLPLPGVVWTDVGATVYAIDSDTFSLAGGSPVGTVSGLAPLSGLARVTFAALESAAPLQQLTPEQFARPSESPELAAVGAAAALVAYRGKLWHSNATADQPNTGWVYAGGGYWQDVAGPITLAAHDAGSMWRMTDAGTITIPAGLSLPPSLVIVPPASGNLSVAVSGGATINGGTTTLTRTRALNPGGVAIVAYGGNAYGLSGCAAT